MIVDYVFYVNCEINWCKYRTISEILNNFAGLLWPRAINHLVQFHYYLLTLNIINSQQYTRKTCCGPIQSCTILNIQGFGLQFKICTIPQSVYCNI